MAKKLYYKIGEACKLLDIQPYVLRYWETEFTSLSPSKSKSGQRTYTEEDLKVIGRIKELLYEEGFTIAGAKKRLEGELDSGGVKPLRELDLNGKAKKAPKKAPAKKAAKVAAEAEESVAEGGAVDTARVKELEAGVEKAMKQAQDILKLLDKGPKKR